MAFGYSLHITGRKPITIRNKIHTQPGIHESADKTLAWLRQNAFSPQNDGWFAAGYGAFRRLTRSNQAIVPSLDTPNRYTNFFSQFHEEDGLAAFQQWMVYLDYREAKENDVNARRLREMGVAAINELLPTGVRYDSIDADARILFNVNGIKVPTTGLSDGYRSVLALAGDLVWRLITAYPNSSNPLHETGVVLIDELDIHLHPVWQRNIAGWLRTQFPNIQFIVTTHSPMVAAGAGEDSLTIKLMQNGGTPIPITQSLFAMSVDDILQSEAFGFLSTYSPETEFKIKRLAELSTTAQRRTDEENQEYQQLTLFIEEHNPFQIPSVSKSLEEKIKIQLESKINEASN
jgi:hypothetical protein